MALVAIADFIPRGPGPYRARPAADGKDDWPYWYVSGEDRRNIMTLPKDYPEYGAVLTMRFWAEALAEKWNNGV